VTIHDFSVEPTDDPLVLCIDVTCSAGTYIRTLAADLGHLLGGGAHLRALRRTAVGPFTIDEAAPPDTVELLDPLAAMRGMARVDVDAATAALVAHGRVLPAWAGGGPWAVVDPHGVLIAVYESFGDGQAKPAVVLPTAASG
jgi:tRNA pseudouridine55 synthase